MPTCKVRAPHPNQGQTVWMGGLYYTDAAKGIFLDNMTGFFGGKDQRNEALGRCTSLEAVGQLLVGRDVDATLDVEEFNGTLRNKLKIGAVKLIGYNPPGQPAAPGVPVSAPAAPAPAAVPTPAPAAPVAAVAAEAPAAVDPRVAALVAAGLTPEVAAATLASQDAAAAAAAPAAPVAAPAAPVATPAAAPVAAAAPVGAVDADPGF